MRFDLRELVFHVVGVHRLDLFSGRRAKNFDDFHQLIDTTLAGEEWLAQHQLRHHTARRPYVCSNPSRAPRTMSAILTNVGRVVGGSEDEFRCAVVPRANIADVGFSCDKDLC